MNICILGATGSIGRQTFDVLKNLPNIQVKAMAASSDYKALADMAQVLRPSLVVLYDEEAAMQFKQLMPDIEVATGMEGLLQCATMPSVDLVVNAVVGSIGLKPTMAALNAKKHVALANKEALVAAGALVMEAARKNNVEIRTMDSEHSAIWQCLQGSYKTDGVKRLILTASGGPFRTWEKSKIAKVTAADALHHPNWNMGAKITIDCATMVNKGLEYLEAHWLFNMPYDKIDILVHPQSIIHSMVEYEDGAVLAQMSAPDMKQPIQYALGAPAHMPRKHTPLDFTKVNLSFEEPDYRRFPCLALVIEAAKIGGTMPTMVNALNEHLVSAFMKDAISFYDISSIIEDAMGTYSVKSVENLSDIEETEAWASEFFGRTITST